MMKPKPSGPGAQGFTLIELMVVVAMIGILSVPLLSMYVQAQKAQESHLLFTRATAALAAQSELVKAAADLQPGRDLPLAPEVAGLVAELPQGRGSLEVGPQTGEPGLSRVVISIQWQDPRGAIKTVHTVILR